MANSIEQIERIAAVLVEGGASSAVVESAKAALMTAEIQDGINADIARATAWLSGERVTAKGEVKPVYVGSEKAGNRATVEDANAAASARAGVDILATVGSVVEQRPDAAASAKRVASRLLSLGRKAAKVTLE
jgi:hypothetical protein